MLNIHDQSQRKKYPIQVNLRPIKKGIIIPGRSTIIKTVKTIRTQSVYSLTRIFTINA
jgi:hypothetical protein